MTRTFKTNQKEKITQNTAHRDQGSAPEAGILPAFSKWAGVACVAFSKYSFWAAAPNARQPCPQTANSAEAKQGDSSPFSPRKSIWAPGMGRPSPFWRLVPIFWNSTQCPKAANGLRTNRDSSGGTPTWLDQPWTIRAAVTTACVLWGQT